MFLPITQFLLSNNNVIKKTHLSDFFCLDEEGVFILSIKFFPNYDPIMEYCYFAR